MAYTPNPETVTQPADTVAAGTAAAEFRALKQYIQDIKFRADVAIIGGVPHAITEGAADSGGVGYKVLRVPN